MQHPSTNTINVRWIFAPFVLLLLFSAVAEGVEIRVFLFAGQSNMAGADAQIAGTGAQNLVDAGLQTDAERNAKFTYGAKFTLSNGDSYDWGDIRGHLTKGVYVHGPEVGFARTLYDNGINNIAIIKVANNFSIPNAGPWPWTNEDSGSSSSDFYNQWTDFIDTQLAALTSSGDTYNIAGIVWHQGIDDALNNATQAQYQTNLTDLIEKLRSDYGTPTTPVVIARSDSPMAPMNAVRAAQVAVATADSYADWINVDDLPHVNYHHFTEAGQLSIGQRDAMAYLDLVSVPEPSTIALLLAMATTLPVFRRK